MKRWEFERAVLGSDLPAPARLILLALAVIADWPGGAVPARFSPSLTTLAELTGLSRRAVMTHLNATERTTEQQGWVIRARPTKARAVVDKERTGYRLAIPTGARRAPELGQEVHRSRAGDALARERDALELGQEVHSTRAPRAHKPDPSRPMPDRSHARASTPEQIVMDATGATPEEATAIARRVTNERQPRSLPGLLRRMAEDGDLAQFLTDLRAARIRARVTDALAEARRGPECEHGERGGNAPHPTSGEPICPQCRTKARRAALKVVPHNRARQESA